MSSWTRAIASSALAVGWGPRSMAKLMASFVHSAPQSTATPVDQLANSAPNGCDMIAMADSWRSRFTFVFFSLLPFVFCIGVSLDRVGSSADGPAFCFRCALATSSRCRMTASDWIRLACFCLAAVASATSSLSLASAFAGAIVLGCRLGALLSLGLPGACDARMTAWGPAFHPCPEFTSTNLARAGRITLIVSSTFASLSWPSCLKEHARFVHFPKNR
jgi:hypothetical protein